MANAHRLRRHRVVDGCTPRLFVSGVRVPAEAKLVVIVGGDEAGEAGSAFAQAFRDFGYHPSALAMMLNVAVTRAGRSRSARLRCVSRSAR